MPEGEAIDEEKSADRLSRRELGGAGSAAADGGERGAGVLSGGVFGALLAAAGLSY